MLSHYWTADEPAEVRRQQMRDWLDDLGEFPAQDVTAACQAWRRSESGVRRPTPPHLRMLAIAEQQRRAPRPASPLAITDMAREPIPAADVIRDHWRKIPKPLLTAAELVLFDESVPVATRRALAAVAAGAVQTIPTVQGEIRRLPLTERHELVSEDDPAVQDELRRMGE